MALLNALLKCDSVSWLPQLAAAVTGGDPHRWVWYAHWCPCFPKVCHSVCS